MGSSHTDNSSTTEGSTLTLEGFSQALDGLEVGALAGDATTVVIEGDTPEVWAKLTTVGGTNGRGPHPKRPRREPHNRAERRAWARRGWY